MHEIDPPGKGLRTPPDSELLWAVQARSPICLLDLAQVIWPALTREAAHDLCWIDGRWREGPLDYLLGRMRGLVVLGLVREGSLRAELAGQEGLTFALLPGEVPIVSIAREAA